MSAGAGSARRRPSRDHVIHLLTEAAEIEHNLLCTYLYAAFSLKVGSEELSAAEAGVVARWRKTIVDVAVEEMGHLVLVNNLLVALGGAAHFDRPNFPVPPGYHPAGFVIRLRAFSKETLDHFIFLERPVDAPVIDAAAFRPEATLERVARPDSLTPSTPDYPTIGAFYGEIRTVLTGLAGTTGARTFLPDTQAQIGPEISALPGLRRIATLDDALAALDVIVEQGEGSSSAKEDCHFTRFKAMRDEWQRLEAANPDFAPAYPAAADPVMRKPVAGLERVWITDAAAARRLDFGNALYGFALVLLNNAWAPGVAQKALVDAAIAVMHALSVIGSTLVRLPSGDPHATAGLTFAVPRNLRAGLPADQVLPLLRERLDELAHAATPLALPGVASAMAQAASLLGSSPDHVPLPLEGRGT